MAGREPTEYINQPLPAPFTPPVFPSKKTQMETRGTKQNEEKRGVDLEEQRQSIQKRMLIQNSYNFKKEFKWSIYVVHAGSFHS